MKNSLPPPYVRTHIPALGKWQSAVFECVRNNITAANPEIKLDELHRMCLSHPMVLGTNDHVWRIEKNIDPVSDEEAKAAFSNSEEKGNHVHVQSFLSKYYLEKAFGQNPGSEATVTDEKPSRYFPDTNANTDAWVETARIWV